MRLTALAGGVGAAKLLSGVIKVMPAEDLTVVVNTGDDFCWMGLYICPDLDTITYTLAGLDNPMTGWGSGTNRSAASSAWVNWGATPGSS